MLDLDKVRESTTLQLVLLSLILMHAMLWFEKITGGLAEYGIAITGILYIWRDREKNKK